MLTLKECRKLIDPKGKKYTDEELKMVLEFHLELATIIVNELKRQEYEKASSIDVAGIQ
ncbi:MAG: hypothetical protein K9J17_16160 [Flavobacteriales bacterium]|nr:hypothetical protein [Flavobacteriales bacterium]